MVAHRYARGNLPVEWEAATASECYITPYGAGLRNGLSVTSPRQLRHCFHAVIRVVSSASLMVIGGIIEGSALAIIVLPMPGNFDEQCVIRLPLPPAFHIVLAFHIAKINTRVYAACRFAPHTGLVYRRSQSELMKLMMFMPDREHVDAPTSAMLHLHWRRSVQCRKTGRALPDRRAHAQRAPYRQYGPVQPELADQYIVL